MFAWMAAVFASSGFVPGEVWARDKDHHWRALKAAFSVWWPVTSARRPHRWCSVFLGRHPAVGRWSGRAWIVGGLAAVAWYGPGPLVAVSPVPLPGVVGVILATGSLVAFVVLVPRVRGLVGLRVPKAVVLVGLLGLVYWALTAVTYHYGYGVDVWSPQLWAELAAVWYGGGNLRWSAFWLLVGDTAAWTALGVFVWARAPRVWMTVKWWGARVMEWVVRATAFGVIGYAVMWVWDYGWWQLANQLARGLATVPGADEVVEHAPGWAILVVLFVFGLVLVNLFSLVLVSVSDALCWVSRMLSIAVYGERIAPPAKDGGDARPERFVGLLERLDRRQLKAAERYQAYLRQRLIDAVENGITPEGWREDLEEDEERWAREDREQGPPRQRRWWPFGAKAQAGEEPASREGQSPAAAGGAPPAEVAPERVGDPPPEPLEEPPVEGPPESADGVALPALGDTAERDKDLAPDPGEDDLDRLAPDAAIGRGPSFDDGPEAVEDAGSQGQSGLVADPDREGAVLREARAAEEERWRSGGGEDRRHEVEQARMEAQAEDDFAYYDDGSDEVSDFGQPDGDPDQYDVWQGAESTMVDGWSPGFVTPPEFESDPFAARSDRPSEDGAEGVGEDVAAEADWAHDVDDGAPEEAWPEAASDERAVAMDHGDPDDPGPDPGDALGVPVAGVEDEFAGVPERGTGESGAGSSGRTSGFDPIVDPRPHDSVPAPRDSGDELALSGSGADVAAGMEDELDERSVPGDGVSVASGDGTPEAGVGEVPPAGGGREVRLPGPGRPHDGGGRDGRMARDETVGYAGGVEVRAAAGREVVGDVVATDAEATAEGPRDGLETGQRASVDATGAEEGAGIRVDDEPPLLPASVHDPLAATYGVVQADDGGAVAHDEDARSSAPVGADGQERGARVRVPVPVGWDVPVPSQDSMPAAPLARGADPGAWPAGSVEGPAAGEAGAREGPVADGEFGLVVEGEESPASGGRSPEGEADGGPAGAEESHGSEVGPRPI